MTKVKRMSLDTPASAATPRPGYVTTEFWSTVLVHGLAVLAVLLDAFKVNWSHMDAAQAAVPVAALIAAAVAQAVYSWHRSRVKIAAADNATRITLARLRPAVGGFVSEVKPLLPLAEKVAPEVGTVVADAEKAVTAATA